MLCFIGKESDGAEGVTDKMIVEDSITIGVKSAITGDTIGIRTSQPNLPYLLFNIVFIIYFYFYFFLSQFTLR